MTQSYLQREPIDLTNPGSCPSLPRGIGEVLFANEGFKVKIIDNSPIPILTLESGSSPSNIDITWEIDNPNALPIDKWQYRIRSAGQTFSAEEGASTGWRDIADSASTDTAVGANAEQLNIDVELSTSYFVQMRLAVGSEYSRLSAEETITTSAATAPASPELSARIDSRQIILSWRTPADGGADISAYKIATGTLSNGLGPFTTLAGSDSETTAHTVSNLVNNVEYIFKILALNSIGDGTPSNQVSATPMPLPPDVPVLLASAANTQVRLSWEAVNDYGNALSKYQYRQRTTTEVFSDVENVANGWQDFALDELARMQTLSALSNGVVYAFQVRAISAIGASDASNEQTATPAPQVPDAPEFKRYARCG